ncbi:hypothetical protein [Metapseudomonas furukawaii]
MDRDRSRGLNPDTLRPYDDQGILPSMPVLSAPSDRIEPTREDISDFEEPYSVPAEQFARQPPVEPTINYSKFDIQRRAILNSTEPDAAAKAYKELLTEAQNIASVRMTYLEEKVLSELGGDNPLLQQEINSAIAQDAEIADLRSKVDEVAAFIRKTRATAR